MFTFAPKTMLGFGVAPFGARIYVSGLVHKLAYHICETVAYKGLTKSLYGSTLPWPPWINARYGTVSWHIWKMFIKE